MTQNNDMPDVLSGEELNALVQAPGRKSATGIRNTLILQLLGWSGLRVGEVCGLDKGDVRENGEGLALYVTGKGGRHRHQHLAPSTSELLRRWLEHPMRKSKRCHALFCTLRGGKRTLKQRQPDGSVKVIRKAAKAGRRMQTEAVRSMLRHYAKKAGIERRVWPHMLRHTSGTLAYQQSRDLYATQMHLGHASPKTTEVYARMDAERLRGLVEGVSLAGARFVDDSKKKPKPKRKGK